jgi:modulator of FtsH protease HflC
MRINTNILIAIVIAIIIMFSSVYTVNENQTAIVLNLGKIVRTDIQPGLRFKLPVIEEVRKFDRRILNMEDEPKRYLTAEKKDVEVDFFVKWKIKDVTTFYKASSGGNEDAARQRLLPMVKSALNNEINQLTLAQVVSSGRSDLTSRLLKKINSGASTLGVEVLDVRIKRINLPQEGDILLSVYNRMRAERTQVASRLRAEGGQLANAIRAQADRDTKVILANAEREAQTLRGEADARAAEVSAEAYKQDAEFYAFYRSMEAYRATMADGKTVMVLDPDSEFLRQFGKQP